MKNFESLGISIIKCQNKEGNEKLKEIQYRINGKIFPLTKRIASLKSIKRLRGELINAGKELSQLECKPLIDKKRKEMIEQIRNMCLKLGEQMKLEQDISPEESSKVFSYQVSQYLKKRSSEEQLSDQDIMYLLVQNKEIAEDYPNPTPKFIDMQKELIDLLYKKYAINKE